MTAFEAIEVLKTDMGCYECTFGCNTPYECKNNDCPFRKAIHLAVERLQIDLLPRMIKAEQTEPTHDLRTETHECVKDTHDKTESTICDFCRYYNSNIPCGSTPSACKEADKFAEEFVNGLKDLRIIEADRKTESNSEKPNNYEPKTCDNCKLKGSTKWCDNQVVCRAYQPKDEPTISKMEQVDKDINVRSKDEPQTADCPFQ